MRRERGGEGEKGKGLRREKRRGSEAKMRVRKRKDKEGEKGGIGGERSKKEKARDPHGWINELFRYEAAGNNLKLSLLHMFNGMKKTNEIPEFVRLADISTIYKGKGPKNELINERGIFVVTILRSILMKLIYFDYYYILDTLSDIFSKQLIKLQV